MASTFQFFEDNGAGATRTYPRTGCNWKNFDSSTDSDYSTYPVTAGNYSFTKYQGGYITGTFNQVSNGKFGHTAGTLGTDIFLWVQTGNVYAAPSTGALSSPVNITAPSGLASAYQTIWFGSSPSGTMASSTVSNPAYTCYWVTQVSTNTGAAPGDSQTATLTFSYDES